MGIGCFTIRGDFFIADEESNSRANRGETIPRADER
jgi:hypothetical protein